MTTNLPDLYTALAKARLEFGSVTKSKTAKAGTYSYDYADLAGVIDATAVPLARQGIVVFQSPEVEAGRVIIHTTLVHSSGASLTFPPLPMPIAQNTPQGIGSAITYGRRYALTGILNLAAEDDDGKTAGDEPPKSQQRPAERIQPAAAQKQAAPPPAAPPSTSAPDDVDGNALFMLDDPPAKRGTVTDATMKRLHALGNEVYGKQWDIKRPALVQHVSKGAISSSADLLEEEARKLCAGMEAKAAQMRQPDAQAHDA